MILEYKQFVKSLRSKDMHQTNIKELARKTLILVKASIKNEVIWPIAVIL